MNDKANNGVTNISTDETLRELLLKEGFKLNPQRMHGEQGTDIVALNYDKVIYIEVIGHKADRGHRTTDFYEVFFRALARLNEGEKKL